MGGRRRRGDTVAQPAGAAVRAAAELAHPCPCKAPSTPYTGEATGGRKVSTRTYVRASPIQLLCRGIFCYCSAICRGKPA